MILERKTNRVVAYVRFSTSKQDAERQLSVIYNYCDKNGLEIDEIVKDEAKSGGKDFRTRELINALNEMQPGDSLLCADEIRLCRSMYQMSVLFWEYVVPGGYKIVFCDTGETIEHDGGSDADEKELIRSVKQYKAQKDLRYMSKTIREGLLAKKTIWDNAYDGFVYVSNRGREYVKGRDKSPFEHVNPGPKVQYRKRQASKEDVQTVNEMIRRMWKAGDSLLDISGELNRLQMPTPRGGRWWPTSVKRVLENN